MAFKQMIVDADICIKIGSSEKYPFTEILFPLIAKKVYIHTVVYEEVTFPFSAKRQLDNLIESGVLEIIDEKNLSETEKILYASTYKNLAEVMMNKNNPHKNKGEVCSLAMAKVKAIPVFATDEKDLQPIIDAKLNTGMANISCYRIIDIIYMIKNGELDILNRKQAKILWALSGKSKKICDNEIWPI